MKLTYLGHSCFVIDDGIRFMFDPFEGIGYEMPITYADVALCSHGHDDHHAVDRINSPRVIDTPFSGRVCSLAIESETAFHDEAHGAKRGTTQMFKVYANGKTFVHLGDIGTVDEKAIAFAKNADFLFIPVGGFYTIDAKQAKELADKTGAKHILPMHYKTKTCALPIAPVTDFTSLYPSFSTIANGCEVDEIPQGVCVVDF